ncbi:mechanosensitive ion channel family protein [Kitasatospora camelliae]|uniref:Mechanosensitive ion channel domain-containing protein n=1 Tax=Kitasatospora camelliae TaxID=3156397 RepID=A0AAU8K4L3_9ACTN
MSWWAVLWPLLAVGGVAVGLLLVDRTVDRAVRRVGPRLSGGPVSGEMLRRCRMPALGTLAVLLLSAVEPGLGLPAGLRPPVRHGLLLAGLASGAWLLSRAVALLIDASTTRYATESRRDPARIRRVRTQTGMLRRLSGALIAVLALATALMTFPAVRSVGASLLASAGLLGLVAGIAAQSALSNVFAGLQLAFGDMVRLGDEVVVAGEWGTVEEITLTTVVVATWDQRRIVMPVSYFVGKPFENWSRRDPGITGTALLHLDHRTPVDELRAEFDRVLKEAVWWDGRGSALQVVDTTPSTIVVRALMTARNASDAFELRCRVRERLIRYLCERHPQALPRIGVSEAPDGTGGGRSVRERSVLDEEVA